MQVSAKKTVFIVFPVLLLLAGIIALTRKPDSSGGSGAAPDSIPVPSPESGETIFVQDEHNGDEPAGETPTPQASGFERHSRWFRSNSGSMALEEVSSRITAQQNEYALFIDYAGPEKLPGTLLPFYNNNLYAEVHILYKQGEESRRQWIFRDQKGASRLIAVPGEYIELYNENEAITEDHRFLEDGGKSVMYFSYVDGSIVRAESWRYAPGNSPDDGDQFSGRIYTDLYRYNRSRFLRAVERIYHEQQEINPAGGRAGTPVRLSFPGRIFEAAKDEGFIKERLGVTPDFFADLTINKSARMVYTTDERGRIITQTLINEQEETVWTISNTWSGDRIVSSLKTEAAIKLNWEYEYDSDGKRIVERNFRNGVLERVVYAEGKREIEELYINGQVILRAIWEDGRKISETGIRH